MDEKFGVAFLTGSEDHQMMRVLSGEFANGFRELGYPAETFDMNQYGDPDKFYNALKQLNCGLIMSLAGVGIGYTLRMQKKYDFAPPFVTMFLDPVIIYWSRVQTELKNNIISVFSDEDIEFVNVQASGRKGIMSLQHSSTEKDDFAWNKKDIDLFYCASLPNAPEEFRSSWQNYDPQINRMLNEMLECHLASDCKSLMQDVSRVLKHYKAPYTLQIFQEFFTTVDRYLRDYHRVESVKKLMKHVPITLVGNGWEKVIDTDHSNLKYIGRIHPKELKTYYERSKIVLNAINYYHPSHERVFAAQSYGAAALSTTSPFYERYYNSEEGIFFHVKDDQIGEKVQNLISDKQRLESIANAGKKVFLQRHTWKHRAGEVINYLNSLA